MLKIPSLWYLVIAAEQTETPASREPVAVSGSRNNQGAGEQEIRGAARTPVPVQANMAQDNRRRVQSASGLSKPHWRVFW